MSIAVRRESAMLVHLTCRCTKTYEDSILSDIELEVFITVFTSWYSSNVILQGMGYAVLSTNMD